MGEKKLLTYKFRVNFCQKVMSTLISVKVWVMASVFIVSTWLLIIGLLTGDHWVQINGILMSTVLVSRQAFKMQMVSSNGKHKDNDKDNDKDDGEIEEINLNV